VKKSYRVLWLVCLKKVYTCRDSTGDQIFRHWPVKLWVDFCEFWLGVLTQDQLVELGLASRTNRRILSLFDTIVELFAVIAELDTLVIYIKRDCAKWHMSTHTCSILDYYNVKLGKCAIAHEECRRGVHLPFLRVWTCRWINNWSLWHMASAVPDLWWPPQLHTAPWPLPAYTAWWLRHVFKQLD